MDYVDMRRMRRYFVTVRFASTQADEMLELPAAYFDGSAYFANQWADKFNELADRQFNVQAQAHVQVVPTPSDPRGFLEELERIYHLRKDKPTISIPTATSS